MTQSEPRSHTPRRIGRVVLAVLLIVPLLEIVTIIAVGQAIGPWWTFGALIALSVIGAALVHREGRRTWNRLRDVLRQGQQPAKEITDAGLVLLGGAMLLTPGFLTDALGLFFVLPLTRPVTRTLVHTLVAKNLLSSHGRQKGQRARGTSTAGPGRPGSDNAPHQPGAGQVIEGQVIDGPHRGPDADAADKPE